MENECKLARSTKTNANKLCECVSSISTLVINSIHSKSKYLCALIRSNYYSYTNSLSKICIYLLLHGEVVFLWGSVLDPWSLLFTAIYVHIKLKEMATHSSTLSCKIPWIEEPSSPQSMGMQRIRHDWSEQRVHMYTHTLILKTRVTSQKQKNR